MFVHSFDIRNKTTAFIPESFKQDGFFNRYDVAAYWIDKSKPVEVVAFGLVTFDFGHKNRSPVVPEGKLSYEQFLEVAKHFPESVTRTKADPRTVNWESHTKVGRPEVWTAQMNPWRTRVFTPVLPYLNISDMLKMNAANGYLLPDHVDGWYDLSKKGV